MNARHDTTLTRAWMRDGTAVLIGCMETLDDAAFGAPTSLPGWTRAHVLGHLARNAEALTRLATWARTGVETPMYVDREQRNAEIKESATHPPDVLRAEVRSTAADLDSALDALTEPQWQAPVRSALGREIPAAEIPWMRVREVWLHAVDLAAGVTVDALPPALIDVLLDDVTAALSKKEGCPALTLAPADRSTSWDLGDAPARSAVTEPAAQLAGWLTGRVSHPGLPTVPTWL